MIDLVLVRLGLTILLASTGFILRPFGWSPLLAGLAGAICGMAAIGLEMRVRQVAPARLLGGALGGALGLGLSILTAMVVRSVLPAGPGQRCTMVAAFVMLAYLGARLGMEKGEGLIALVEGPAEPQAAQPREPMLLVDTSAIIDGRIADVSDAGFLRGLLTVPEFVLQELQAVADSSDAAKRQRGRRGLDVLQRMQAADCGGGLRILEEDVTGVRQVDLKLIELAKRHGADILTTDFNLNKVAHLHGITVLNVNDLANALKPVVLPGERIQIAILKEGKEFDQGVGYLDDGTMVVVDHARRLIGRMADIGVTSVLQTASGKMIFGRLDGARPEDGQRATVSLPRGANDPLPIRIPGPELTH